MSQGKDIRSYFETVSKKYHVDERVQFNTEVLAAKYEEDVWKVKARNKKGEELNKEFDFVITACGVLHHPVIPDFEGKDKFKGVSFHTARWNHSVDLKNKKVAVIGTGSTSAQLIMPLSRQCKSVTVFQRTAQWIFPFPNREYSAIDKLLAKNIPMYRRLVRMVYDQAFDHAGLAVTRKGWQRKLIQDICRLNLRLSVRDTALRKKLTPDYDPLCKRLVLSDNFYRAIQQKNVQLVTETIQRIEEKGIRTDDNILHEVDVIVYATGFNTQAYVKPINVFGLNNMTLEKAWGDGPRAYRTIAMPDFPNMFMLQGPNSPVGNFSLISTAESQSSYIVKCLERYRQSDFKAMVPSHEACDAFNNELVAAMGDTVWMSGCSSWYISDAGVPLSWPWGPREFRDSMRKPNWEEYTFIQ
jgi:cation diffusion facilitator CzcD-associated flavoprotein CzcO